MNNLSKFDVQVIEHDFFGKKAKARREARRQKRQDKKRERHSYRDNRRLERQQNRRKNRTDNRLLRINARQEGKNTRAEMKFGSGGGARAALDQITGTIGGIFGGGGGMAGQDQYFDERGGFSASWQDQEAQAYEAQQARQRQTMIMVVVGVLVVGLIVFAVLKSKKKKA